MSKYTQIACHGLIIFLLTLITQVGGLLWLVSILLLKYIGIKLRYLPIFYFVLHTLVSLWVLPVMAPLAGRTALPVLSDGPIRPASWLTVWCNRRYVKPELYISLQQVTADCREQDPDMVLLYLDGAYPLGAWPSVIPHLSHDDGMKLDLSFAYKSGDEYVPRPKSLTGYGAFESAADGQILQADVCKEAGFVRYSMTSILGVFRRRAYQLDPVRTRLLIATLLEQPMTYRMFVEPHLLRTLSLKHPKLRYQGCHSVRHDDHIHWEVR